jgi:hypothetical protein
VTPYDDLINRLRAKHAEWLKTATPEELAEARRPWLEAAALERRVKESSGKFDASILRAID